jgi:hypothetical protein
MRPSGPPTYHENVVRRAIRAFLTVIVSDSDEFHENPLTVPLTHRREARTRFQHTR